MEENVKLVARLGPYLFDRKDYDPDTDTVTVTLGEPQNIDEWVSPEGDTLLIERETGAVLGITIGDYNNRISDGPIEVTLPGPDDVDPADWECLFLWMPGGVTGTCN